MAPIDGARVAVCMFAKPPRPGLAKTRLAASLGDDVAARLARAFLLDTWALIRSLEWADPLLATTDVDDPFWQELPGDAVVWPQGDGDLGERMERVFHRALEDHAAAIIIGSDVPGLPVKALDQARNALRIADFAIGPADDGGYYLIGCRRCPPGVFAGVRWSASTTRAETEAGLRSRGQVVLPVLPWFDVDEVEDLLRLRHLGAGLGRVAPETARVLETIALDVPSGAAHLARPAG